MTWTPTAVAGRSCTPRVRRHETTAAPIEDERAEYKEAHRAAKKVVTKSHPGRMYTRRGELNKQESSDQLIESAEGLDC